MKIKKLVTLPILLASTLVGCGLTQTPINQTASGVVASTTISDNSKIGKIAQEIGYDNYMKGSWSSLEFTYEIKEIASVGASIQYYTIVFNHQEFGGKVKETYYIKISSGEWEIIRVTR